MKPPTTLELVWQQDLVFTGRSGDTTITLDSASKAGPSPVQAVAFALAGCMGMDVVHILRKGRHDLRALSISLVAERAQEDPQRIVSFDLTFHVTGGVPADAVERAVALSHDKYCSVWHTLRQDIPLTSRIAITAAV